MTITRFLAAMLILLGCCGCQNERQRYDGTGQVDKPADTNATATTAAELRKSRIVLFAPTGVGPLAKSYPAARLDFPFAMADRVDLLMPGYDGRVGEILPDSDAQRWQEGRVPATAGSHVVVLTQVVSLNLVKGMPGLGNRPDHVEAVVELRALDVNGVVIYRKRAAGNADATTSPKVLSADGGPESRASWAAFDVALSGFRDFLAGRNEMADQPLRLNQQPAAAMVLVNIDSDPSKADVLINGTFRGTTPLTLNLPAREVTVHIERQGFAPWQRVLVPSLDMRIQPALVALPAAAPAAAAEPGPAQAPVDANAGGAAPLPPTK